MKIITITKNGIQTDTFDTETAARKAVTKTLRAIWGAKATAMTKKLFTEKKLETLSFTMRIEG